MLALLRRRERGEPLIQRLVHLALQRGVPVIFNRVIGASFERLGDFRPAIAVQVVRVDEYAVFLDSPLSLVDDRASAEAKP